jgi:hypothetical protein
MYTTPVSTAIVLKNGQLNSTDALNGQLNSIPTITRTRAPIEKGTTNTLLCFVVPLRISGNGTTLFTAEQLYLPGNNFIYLLHKCRITIKLGTGKGYFVLKN